MQGGVFDMKVIAGEFKGRFIDMPEGIKPTSNKAREALFEILKTRIAGASFLDIYCGSGAIGIEALSRGAKSAAFIDNNFKCVSVLKKNLKHLGISGLSSINIYNKDALMALKTLSAARLSFDIVFLDPPYNVDTAKNTLIAISNYDILARDVIIVAETYKKEKLPDDIGALKKYRIALYGDTKLEFFSYE